MLRWICFALLLSSCSLHAQSVSPAQRPQVALVLSGGGARGGAHVGVLKALEEARVPIDLIAGTSFGALVGGLYAVGYSASDIELILQQVDWNQLLNDSPDRRLLNLANRQRNDRQLFDVEFENLQLKLPRGLQAGQKIRQLLNRMTAAAVVRAENDFDRLSIPFRAVATDILTGEPYVFATGPISTAIRASIAVPGIFTPVEHGERLLVDGGLAANLPVDVALDAGADIIIAVDVSTPLLSRKEQVKSLFDVLDQAISIHIEEHKSVSLKRADLVIMPDLQEFSSADFARASEIVALGAEAVAARHSALMALLDFHDVPRDRTVPLNRLGADFDIDTYVADPGPIAIASSQMDGLKKYPGLASLVPSGSRNVTVSGVDRRVSQLYGTDLFSDVNYRLESAMDRNLLVFEVQEAPSTRLGFGIRYDPDYNFTGTVDLLTRGLLSRRTDLTFQGLVGNVQKARLELSHRVLGGDQLVIAPSVHYQAHERRFFESNRLLGEFEDARAGVRLAVRNLLGNRAKVELGYQLERVDLGGTFGERLQSEQEALGGIDFSLEYDSLDSFDLPTTGWRGGALAAWKDPAFGGDFAYRQFEASVERFFKLNSKTTIGASAGWGLLQGDSPVYERFFAGGAHYLSVSAAPFLGLERDQLRARQFYRIHLLARRQLKRFQLGVVQGVDVGFKYQAGFFSQGQRIGDLGDLIHGFGGGLYLNTRFLGPIYVEFGGSDNGDFNTYFSVGHFF